MENTPQSYGIFRCTGIRYKYDQGNYGQTQHPALENDIIVQQAPTSRAGDVGAKEMIREITANTTSGTGKRYHCTTSPNVPCRRRWGKRAAGVNSGRAFDVIDLNLVCDGYVLKYKLNQTEGNSDTTGNKRSQGYSFEKLGMRYLTINVENVDPFIQNVKENSIQFKLVTLPNGYRVLLLHDPDGALIEISGK